VDSAQALLLKSIARSRAPEASGASRPACIARRAISATPTRLRPCSASTRRWAPAKPAAASAAWSAWTLGLVIPNDKLTLRAGAVKPMQTPAWQECQDDLMRHAEASRHPARHALVQADCRAEALGASRARPNWNGKWNQHWFGVDRFFEYLETKAYKMHIRVLLSKYRSYTHLRRPAMVRGLKTESLLWRIGTKAQADARC